MENVFGLAHNDVPGQHLIDEPMEPDWLQIFTEEQETLLNSLPELWTKYNSDVGLMTICEPVKIRAGSEFHPRRRQYPLKQDAKEGIQSVIEDLLSAGALIECTDSPCNPAICQANNLQIIQLKQRMWHWLTRCQMMLCLNRRDPHPSK